LQKLKDLEAKKADFDGKLQGKNGELVGKRKDIQRSEEESKRIVGEIKTREDQLLKLQELNQYQLWLSELFIPAVKLIETNVLANINSEFNMLFQKWLGHLLEGGDIIVRVDENFTPIIEQDGYEMEVDSLSGGEKTSVALAYRLALNVMVKKVCEAMQSNLLILDEPTDGFSREQLFRLRDILNELKCEQVIAVSHESELEGFVDKIYRITKEAGESKISAA
jgi:exonuclease SbcC